ncbi:glycosyltransferase, partial [bacterium]|nr:glycosyltransferase [bacterium]
MLYSVFPLAVIATFFILLGIVYRGRTRINEVFAEYRRPAALRRLVGLWFGVIFGVFVVVQSLRIPFFEYVIGKLAHPSQVFSSWHDLAHTVGLVVLITAELTIIWQWSHYMTQCWRGITKYKIPPLPPMPNPAPSVVVLVPSCDEDPEILERSLSSVSHLRYPNLSVWLVENSRRPEFKEQAVKLAQKHGVGVLHVRNRGNKGRALNDAMKMINPAPEYLAILDADQRVQPEFLEKTVPILHGDPKLAFVQTAQEYENSNATLVCRAAAQQEMLHYDTILEGKGAVGMAMCCGTNFVMRWSALADVGGWDEESICEDMATSFDLHWKGWRSAYVRRIYSIGVGPLTLYAYWKQHWRWATGGTTILKRVIRGILTRKPIPVPYKVAVEYLWSSGFYTMTLALALLATLPILLLLFVRFGTGQGLVGPVELRPLEWVYLSVYPFYVAVMLFPFIHMKLRGYSLRNLLLVQGILANTVPVYLNAITKVMLGRKS